MAGRGRSPRLTGREAICLWLAGLKYTNDFIKLAHCGTRSERVTRSIRGFRMTETTGQQATEREAYIQRVTALIAEAAEWCRDHGLETERKPYTVREERTGSYDAPALYVSRNGVSVAKVIPRGSRIIAAYGRVDIVGILATQALLYYVGKGPEFKSTSTAGGKTVSTTTAPMLHGVDGDGWYWIESSVRRAKRVDESLFLDLLTDVSDYEF